MSSTTDATETAPSAVPPPTALDSLRGAASESGLPDGKLIGVLYLLGYASEHLGAWREAEAYYRRVFASDIHFRDVGERLRRAESMA